MHGATGHRSGAAHLERQRVAVQIDAQAVSATLSSLPSLRERSLTSSIAPQDVIQEYDAVVGVLLDFDDQVALSSSDPQLSSSVATTMPT